MASQTGGARPPRKFNEYVSSLSSVGSYLEERFGRNHSQMLSITVGALTKSGTEQILISNCQSIDGRHRRQSTEFVEESSIVSDPQVIVRGRTRHFTKAMKKYLVDVATTEQNPEVVYGAMSGLNAMIANQEATVCRACYASHVETGLRGRGLACNAENEMLPGIEQFGIGTNLRKQITGGGRLIGLEIFRFPVSEEDYQSQLLMRPTDQNLHSGYGYLLLRAGRFAEAEKCFRTALELEPNFTDAKTGLALALCSTSNEHREVEDLFLEALADQPFDTNATASYARYLIDRKGDIKQAEDLVERAIAHTGESTDRHLHFARADVYFAKKDFRAALEQYQHALSLGIDTPDIYARLAQAMHLVGANTNDEVIGAYRTAIGKGIREKAEASMRLNLAQVLFQEQRTSEALKELRTAEQLGIDKHAQLEAGFYRICHGIESANDVFNTIRSLVHQGARLDWDMTRNIESAIEKGVSKEQARLLAMLANAMESGNIRPIDNIRKQWLATN